MSFEQLARLTAQTNAPRIKGPAGGISTITAQDIAALAAAAPHMCWHALMVKYCDDEISKRKLFSWLRERSRREWFDNPANATRKIEARQLNQLAQLAIEAYNNPQINCAKSIETRASFINANHETYKKNFQAHYAFLLGELSYLEQLGLSAVYRAKRLDDE